MKNLDFPIIREYTNNLSREFCDHLIQKFEKQPDKYQGTVGARQVDTNVKDSLDYKFSGNEDWYIEDDYVQNKLFDASLPFIKEHCDLLGYTFPNGVASSSGFQIQRTLPGTIGYKWHSDENYWFCHESRRAMRRMLTYLWYLNDCEEGYTEFADRRITPECGKLILFFADPALLHRGIAPKTGKKYIMTGWISTQIEVGNVTEINGAPFGPIGINEEN